MFATLRSLHSRGFQALGLAAGIALGAQQVVAEPPSPFLKFIGNWSGAGQIVGSNGHRESIRCRAEYAEAKGGSALDQGIVCASESFKLNIHGYVESSGESTQGYWKEATRDVSGQVTGRVSDGRFVGELSAPSIRARISLTSHGRIQVVSIQPRAGDISDVRIELKRNG
jgi:hypothetical protein